MIRRIAPFLICLLAFAALGTMFTGGDARAGDGVTLLPAPPVNPAPPEDPDPPDSTVPPVGACGDCGCFIAGEAEIFGEIPIYTTLTRNALYPLFWNYQNWIVSNFFDGGDPSGQGVDGPDNGSIRGAMMAMAEQLTTVGMEQVAIFGTFLDAKQQLETQETIQGLVADAHKRYQPDLDLCTIGTMSEAIAAADQNAEVTAVVMSKHSIDRQLNSVDSASRNGIGSDLQGRLQQFITYYCDPSDANGAYAAICPTPPTSAASVNRDIDYTRMIEQTPTLDIDFSTAPTTQTADERDIMALDSNLFAHDVFRNLNANILAVGSGPESLLAARSVVAKRSVAENSFFAIASMRADGSADETSTQPYLKAVLTSLGVSSTDADLQLGKRPSYYAIMGLMADKIYETPTFFTNLYDTPANIARKDVAMQAIDLMLDRDQYKSELRSEADMAVLLELKLDKAQDDVQGRANWLIQGGKTD